MNKNNFLSNSYKLILPLGFFTIIVMMIATTFFAESQIKASSELMIDNIKQHNINSKLLRTMSLVNSNRAMVIQELSKLEDPFQIDDKFQELNKLSTDFVVARERFADQKKDPVLKKLFIEQGQITRKYVALEYKVQELLQQENYKESSKLFSNEILPGKKIVTASIEAMSNYEFIVSENSFIKLQNSSDIVSTTIFLLNILAIFISTLLAFFVLKKQEMNDKELVVLATTDILTNLPNRSNFIQNINYEINDNPDSVFAVVYFDIDNFKTINDNYGHEVGDKILKRYASKLSSSIKSNDVLSRFGGDEFVLLLRSITSESDAFKFVRNLSEKLDTTCTIDDKEIFISSSIGASLYSNDGSDAKTLLKNADIAMYCAKESGENCYRFYSEETKSIIAKEHTITHALRTIIKNNNSDNQLFLKYQPLQNITDGDITECEALIRWKTDEGIEVPTAKFITIAEKSNLIDKINLLVLKEACRQQKEWQLSGNYNTRININLSGNKVSFGNLIEQFKVLMEMYKLTPSLFGIELTERTILDISKESINELNDFRNQGMKISIDDFGTGYSSLSYLKILPITTIKIDKSFVSGLPNNKDDRELVKTIITLGHSLKLDIVAEGVETIEQLNFLKTHACDIAQGYYLHRPLEQKQLTELKIAA